MRWKRRTAPDSRRPGLRAGLRSLALFSVLLGGLLTGSACGSSPEANGPIVRSSIAGAPTAVRIANFDRPVEVRTAPGFPGLMFVVEQEGRVMVVRRGQKLETPFLDIRGRVRSGGEQGLLSIAFPPDYRTSGRLYAYFTDGDGDIVVEQFRRSSAVRAGAGSGRRIIEVPHRDAENHNGGQMHFLGRTLYFGVGDGGGAGDPEGDAQNPNSLLGKMLAIVPTASGEPRYRSPDTNPYVGRAGRDEVFAIGLRNPFRWSFDLRQPDRPMIAIADVGQDEWEEVSYLPLADARGANFGWNAFEARSPFDGFPGERPVGTVFPKVALPHPANCSVTGGVVVRDPDLGSLRGRYIFSDFCRSGIQSVRATTETSGGPTGIGVEVPLVTSFAERGDRRIFLTSLAGGLYRLDR